MLSQASQCGGYELSQGVLPDALDDEEDEVASALTPNPHPHPSPSLNPNEELVAHS